ncbi:hypothetical protein FRC20_003780 [Serendipita sp. 405]|nr:hypothetical protein FRC15_008294 [Serendipita sp. 397]KAG8804670.1 hypothetical protein FRC16_003560 [Serendipita sp. 398]KAG8879021.1 hypothetical protein FRC20_003780 [Serendipita sp. 405]
MAFPTRSSPERQTNVQETMQTAQQPRENLLREENHDNMSLSYTNQAYRPIATIGGLQPPTQQNPLRHRQSASNDALRAFGAVPNTSGESANKPSFPQELYSSSAGIPETSVFSRALNGPEYDFVQSSSSQVSGPNTINGANGGTAPPASMLARSNAFGNAQPLMPTFSNPSVPALPSAVPPPASLPGLSMAAPLAPQTASHLPQQATQPISQAHSVSLSHSSVQQILPGAPPAAQLMQMLQNLPPQQKNAVMGRLHELASGAPQSSIPPLAIPPNGLSPPQLQAPTQEEISTIFVVGFPDDMTEREFQNMFTFCPGYEAATLKVPTKEQASAAPNAVVAAAASALAGASDPYNLVTVNSGGVVVDQGNNTTATTTSAWASGLEDPYTRQVLAAAAASSNSSTSELAQQLALAQQGQPRKQIIGFAKFRSREDAQHARDVLHGRRIDLEKGSLLKAEMAKKNLHTKRGTILPQAPTTGAGIPSVFPDALMPSMNGKASTMPPLNSVGLVQTQTESDKLGLLPSISAGASPNDMTLAAHAQMSLNISRAPDSPTMKSHRPGEVSSFGPGMTSSLSGPMDLYNSGFIRGLHSTKHGAQPLTIATNLGPGGSEGFHALPNKPASDIAKSNPLPPINSHSSASSYGGSPPSITEQPDQDAGYISDSFSTSHQSESSRSQSIPRYSGYTPPPLEDESHAHLPQHLLTDDVLGTPQQTDYSSKLFDSLTSDLPWAAIQGEFKPSRKMTDASNYGGGNDAPGFVGSSASSVAGSVSSGGADSMSISTASIQGAPTSGPPSGSVVLPPEVSRPRQGTMGSMKGSGGPSNVGLGGDQTRTSGEHLRGRGNAADQNPPINTLYVGNLPSNPPTPSSAKILEDALVQLFTRSVGFSKLSFRQKNNGPMCFVEFDDVSNAAKALNDLYGNTLNGLVKNGGIRLSYSKNPLGVRTSAPGTTNTNKVTSPLQSPTIHGSIQFGNIAPNMQDLPPGLGRPTLSMPPSQPMEMPRGRMRGDTLETSVGPISPSGRFLPASPPTQGPGSAFGNLGMPMPPFNRPPINLGGPMSQPFGMPSSPPATSPISYQPSTSFQPFGQLDLNRESGQSLYDTTTGP